MEHEFFVYLEIKKGMYELLQPGNIYIDKLKQHLSKLVYALAPITPGLWKNQTRLLRFSLVVDGFGVQ